MLQSILELLSVLRLLINTLGYQTQAMQCWGNLEGQEQSPPTWIGAISWSLCPMCANWVPEGWLPGAWLWFLISWCHPQYHSVCRGATLYPDCEGFMGPWYTLWCISTLRHLSHPFNRHYGCVDAILKWYRGNHKIFHYFHKNLQPRYHTMDHNEWLWSGTNEHNQTCVPKDHNASVLVACAPCNADAIPHRRIPRTLGTCLRMDQNTQSIKVWFHVGMDLNRSLGPPQLCRLSQGQLDGCCAPLGRGVVTRLDDLLRRWHKHAYWVVSYLIAWEISEIAQYLCLSSCHHVLKSKWLDEKWNHCVDHPIHMLVINMLPDYDSKHYCWQWGFDEPDLAKNVTNQDLVLWLIKLLGKKPWIIK